MTEEEREDLLWQWASWWVTHGAPGYTGAMLPPIQRTREAGIYPHLLRRTYRQRSGRRERTGKQAVLPFSGNLRLPLG